MKKIFTLVNTNVIASVTKPVKFKTFLGAAIVTTAVQRSVY